MCHTRMNELLQHYNYTGTLNDSLTLRRNSTPSHYIRIDSSMNCSMQCDITPKSCMDECESNRESAKELNRQIQPFGQIAFDIGYI